MEEKVIIQSKTINGKKFRTYCFTPAIIMIGYTILFYALNINECRRHPSKWYASGYYEVDFVNYIGNYIFTNGIIFLLGIFLLFLGAYIYWAFNNIGMTVTDKRVYGNAKFGKRVDLPLDSISAVSIGMLKTIAVATSSGKIIFGMVLNRNEMYDAISKLLVERQNNSINNTIKHEIPQSNADELKKYKDLLDNGIISQEEFEAKKKQLLDL